MYEAVEMEGLILDLLVQLALQHISPEEETTQDYKACGISELVEVACE